MKFRFFTIALLSVVLYGANLFADAPAKPMKHKMFQTVQMDHASLLQKGDAKMFCPECGMTLPMFYKTNHSAVVHGEIKQYCSIHCLVEDQEKGSDLTDIQVVDTQTLQFIPVEKAFYVVGSDVKGTMSMSSKYAFGTKEGANLFAKKHGGKVMDFKGASMEAKKDFPKDSAMISKKQAMMAKKGEMIYTKMCKPTTEHFSTPAQAKAYVLKHGLCKNLDGKQLQAVGLYLGKR